MGDRAAACLVIYASPPDREQAVIDLLNEWGLRKEGSLYAVVEAPLALGEAYVDDEASLTICHELGAALAEMEVTFELCQDPKYEYDGTIVIHVPGLGVYSGECDAEGTIHVSAHDIDRMIAEASTREALAEALDAATAKRWRGKLRQLRGVLAGGTREHRSLVFAWEDGTVEAETVMASFPEFGMWGGMWNEIPAFTPMLPGGEPETYAGGFGPVDWTLSDPDDDGEGSKLKAMEEAVRKEFEEA